jgi:hypothetical protein
MTFQNCLYPADTAPELDSLRIDWFFAIAYASAT